MKRSFLDNQLKQAHACFCFEIWYNFCGDIMTEEIKKHIKEKLSLVPTLPGSYQMKDKNGNIIYVGKAKKWLKKAADRGHEGAKELLKNL